MVRFLRLWLVMAFSYSIIKFVFDLAMFGWIDLRSVVLWQLALIPLGQSVVFWFVTRRVRRATASI